MDSVQEILQSVCLWSMYQCEPILIPHNWTSQAETLCGLNEPP